MPALGQSPTEPIADQADIGQGPATEALAIDVQECLRRLNESEGKLEIIEQEVQAAKDEKKATETALMELNEVIRRGVPAARRSDVWLQITRAEDEMKGTLNAGVFGDKGSASAPQNFANLVAVHQEIGRAHV